MPRLLPALLVVLLAACGDAPTHPQASLDPSLGVAPAAPAPRDIVRLESLGEGGSLAMDVNVHGQVTGQFLSDNGVQHAFLWKEGTLLDLGSPGSGFSVGNGINDAGQVAGTAWTGTAQHAVLWSGGVMSDLGMREEGSSAAHAINNAGHVVGELWDAEGYIAHAFLWTGGDLEVLGTPSGTGSTAYGINDAGDVVGSARVNASTHAVLWRNGTFQDLGTLGGVSSEAWDINEAGQVVGTALDADDEPRAFLWEDGVMRDLGTLGGYGSYAYGIDDAGRVVGQSGTAAGPNHAFLWKDGVMTDLGALAEGGTSAAYGIGKNGAVVGAAYEPGGSTPTAVLWPPPDDPESRDDCMNDGWRDYEFENQGQCVRFVETRKDGRS